MKAVIHTQSWSAKTALQLRQAATDPETWGAVTGVLGALFLALSTSFSRYGWLLFLSSNIAWIAFAVRGGYRKLLVQQLAFTLTSLVGIWNFLLSSTAFGVWLKSAIEAGWNSLILETAIGGFLLRLFSSLFS